LLPAPAVVCCSSPAAGASFARHVPRLFRSRRPPRSPSRLWCRRRRRRRRPSRARCERATRKSASHARASCASRLTARADSGPRSVRSQVPQLAPVRKPFSAPAAKPVDTSGAGNEEDAEKPKEAKRPISAYVRAPARRLRPRFSRGVRRAAHMACMPCVCRADAVLLLAAVSAEERKARPVLRRPGQGVACRDSRFSLHFCHMCGGCADVVCSRSILSRRWARSGKRCPTRRRRPSTRSRRRWRPPRTPRAPRAARRSACPRSASRPLVSAHLAVLCKQHTCHVLFMLLSYTLRPAQTARRA
jgi:hypothetical protein